MYSTIFVGMLVARISPVSASVRLVVPSISLVTVTSALRVCSSPLSKAHKSRVVILPPFSMTLASVIALSDKSSLSFYIP